ncbi:MAG TPA: DNA polymerase III subunit delta [Microbacteriaceae bacterium]|nr:DNA polymerase III subunit delta [Microbacteriaceae bacterium]
MASRGTSRRSARAAEVKAAIPRLSWAKARPAPVVLVSGRENVLADRAIAHIKEALLATDPNLEVNDIDAAGYGAGELLTLASPSLFADPRLIRVEAVEAASDPFLTDALAYLAAPADDTVLVLRHHGGTRGKRLLDRVRAGLGGGVEVVCAEVTRDRDRADFARAEFGRAGREATPGAARALVDAFNDLAGLAAACSQLVSDTEGLVDEGVVRRYYAGRVVANGFAVADQALAGRAGLALVTLRQAWESGTDPVPIVAALASKIRAMARVAALRGTDAAVARQAGMAPWQVERARRDLRGWGDTSLARAILAVADADAAVKGAARDPKYAVEKAVRLIAREARG